MQQTNHYHILLHGKLVNCDSQLIVEPTTDNVGSEGGQRPFSQCVIEHPFWKSLQICLYSGNNFQQSKLISDYDVSGLGEYCQMVRNLIIGAFSRRFVI